MRTILALVTAVALWGGSVSAVEPAKATALRASLFDAAQKAKVLMAKNTPDYLMLMSLFDSGILATTSLDGYFHVLGVFESFPGAGTNTAAIDFLSSWLSQMKRTNDLALNNLRLFPEPIAATSKEQLELVRGVFTEYGLFIDAEMRKIEALKAKAKSRGKAAPRDKAKR